MDIWQLTIFINVVEKKSFSLASKAINLSQPTVSSHIKDLEEYFECKLLDRLGREVIPTKSGEILYSYAKKIVSLTKEAETAVFEFFGNIKGDFTLGGSTIPAGYIIPRLIGPFSRQFPGVNISVLAGDTAQIIKMIENGEAEIGIVGASTNNAKITQEKLIDDEMKLIVPYSHKWADREEIDTDMLFEDPFLLREEGSGTWRSILLSMENAKLDPTSFNIAARMGSTAAIIQGILSKAGISILSTIAVEDDITTGRLKALTVKGLDLHRCFYIATHKKRTLSPIAKEFLSFLKQRI
ncbi:MAG: LysR family transcriptional regulator [Desulfobacterales bacterium]|nr:LysR family transcriptional regulator [Desulfobacterales bacterium]